MGKMVADEHQYRHTSREKQFKTYLRGDELGTGTTAQQGEVLVHDGS